MPIDVRVTVNPIVDEYLQKGDVSSENANCMWTPNGLLMAVGGECLGRDNIFRIEQAGFDNLAQKHKDGEVHIHDLSLSHATPYCAGNSLPTLLAGGITSAMSVSRPAKHLRTAINHIINFVGAMSNEFAGAQAFNEVDVHLAPYAYKAYLDYLASGADTAIALTLTKREVKQCIQEMMFHLNFNSRWGSQTPFTNITLAITCPSDLKNSAILVAGRPLHELGYPDAEGKTYGEMQGWQGMIVNAILDCFIEGDGQGNGFTFPILTINVTEDFFDQPIKDKIFELTAKYGTPYFQNFINGESGGQKINPDDVRSMCCRLMIDKKEIQKHVGGLFGHADQTGSLQVVTISLPFVAMRAMERTGKDKQLAIKEFFQLITETMEEIRDEQLWKREVVIDHFKRGFFPMAKSNFGRGFDTFFTTVGFIGLWECVQILLGREDSLLSEDGLVFGESILDFMAGKVGEFTEQTGKLFNLEATPAESATYKLAKKALKIFPDIPHRGLKKSPYFTNSCHIPVEYQDDLNAVFRTQNSLQTIPSGGTVVHFYLGESMTPKQVEDAVRFICENTKLPYFSMTAVYSMCEICGRIPGAHAVCPNEHTDEELTALAERRPELVREGFA